MSDQRRVGPAPESFEAGAAAAEVHVPASANPDSGRTPLPPGDPGARRRARLTLRIPDDEVVRPPSIEADPPLVETARRRVDSIPLMSEDSGALMPTRIITINPEPTPGSRAGDMEVPIAQPSDDGFDDEPTPLVRRIQRTPPPSPGPVVPVTLSFPDASGPPASVPPATTPSFPPPAPIPSSRAPSFPPVQARAPSPLPVPPAPGHSIPAPAQPVSHSIPTTVPTGPSMQAPAKPPPSQSIQAPAPPTSPSHLASTLPTPPSFPAPPPATEPPIGEVRGVSGEAELSLDDLLALEATPSSPAIVASVPAVRPRLPSHPPVPSSTKKAAPVERPSKPPLVIVPPHMGNLAPQPPEGATSRRKGRFWWEDLFNDDYLRATERLTEEQLQREVHFIEESLGIERGGAVLDLACGTGLHAIELTRRGYRVVAFDLSLAMLARAGDEAQERNAKLNFVQGDMREMTFVEQFDGVYCWNTSFGFFEEEKNALVIDRIHDALKVGGLLLLDVLNRDFIVPQSPSLAWFEGDGCVCMDEMVVDFITSRMRVKRTMMLDDGRSREIEFSIRVYSLHELGKMLHDHGFKVCEVTGRIATPGVFFGHESPRTIILAEKR